MTGTNWRPIGRIDFGRLAEARLQAHYAVQWLARAARAFVPSKPDDSHTNLGWEEAVGGLTTHKMQGARLALKMPDLTLAVFSAHGGARMYALEGRRDADIRAWLGEEMAALGLDARQLDARLPYGIPVHGIATGASYGGARLSDAMREFAAWFANANASLGSLRGELGRRGFDVTPVRCWPHHFDIAMRIEIDPAGGERARSVGIGLSPGDEYYEEPYFYVTPWPYPSAARLPRLPEPGHWHVRGFTGAVVPARRVLDAKARQTETEGFLRAAVDAAIKSLG